MLTTSILSVLALSNAAAAVTRIPVTASYDDIQGVIPALDPVLGPALGVSPPDPYKYLVYAGYLTAVPIKGAVSIQPTSPQRVAFAPAILGGAPIVQPTIVTSSETAHFELRSIASGCFVATRQLALAPPIDCTIRYTGTKTNGEEVTHDFEYKAGQLLGLPLSSTPVKKTEFPLPKFSKLVQLKPQVIKSAVPQILGVTVQMAFDDMVYVATLKK